MNVDRRDQRKRPGRLTRDHTRSGSARMTDRSVARRRRSSRLALINKQDANDQRIRRTSPSQVYAATTAAAAAAVGKTTSREKAGHLNHRGDASSSVRCNRSTQRIHLYRFPASAQSSCPLSPISISFWSDSGCSSMLLSKWWICLYVIDHVTFRLLYGRLPGKLNL